MTDSQAWTGKVAVITGGGSGIGRATARALAAQGVAVVLGNRKREQGEAVVEEITAAGGRAEFLTTDVTRSADIEALVRHTVERFGRLDLAFNNAGVDGPLRRLHEQDESEVELLFKVNVSGICWAMQHEIRAMLKNPAGARGAIVNNSSVLGLVGNPGWTPYVGSKHAVAGMTRSAALDYAAQGIRINAVAPGPIDTPLLTNAAGGDPKLFARAVPMGRIGRPEEVAAAVLFLLSEDASYITGHILPVDGGYLAK